MAYDLVVGIVELTEEKEKLALNGGVEGGVTGIWELNDLLFKIGERQIVSGRLRRLIPLGRVWLKIAVGGAAAC